MLIPGQVFKNYKELCLFLNAPVKAGNGKSQQLDHWKKYFTVEKVKHSYRIIEVMMNDLEEMPAREPHADAIWTQHIGIQLYHILAEAVANPESHTNRFGMNQLILSTQDAFEAVGLVNSEFRTLSWNDTMANKNTTGFIFYKAASNKLYQILYRVLKSLNDKKVITARKWYLVRTARGNKTLRLVTFDEFAKIEATMLPLLATKYALKDGTAGNEYNVHLRGLSKAFYKDLALLLEADDIFYNHKVYQIMFLESNLQYFSKYLLQDNEVAYSKGIINKASYDALSKVIIKNIKHIPMKEDERPIAEAVDNPEDFDKSKYFEWLEMTVPLLEEDSNQAENS